MAEWLKAHAWKACTLQKGVEGSNPSLSATFNFLIVVLVFILIPIPFLNLDLNLIPHRHRVQWTTVATRSREPTRGSLHR